MAFYQGHGFYIQLKPKTEFFIETKLPKLSWLSFIAPLIPPTVVKKKNWTLEPRVHVAQKPHILYSLSIFVNAYANVLNLFSFSGRFRESLTDTAYWKKTSGFT